MKYEFFCPLDVFNYVFNYVHQYREEVILIFSYLLLNMRTNDPFKT